MPRVVKVGDRGCDYALQPKSDAQLAADGLRFKCRYSKGVSGASNNFATKPGEIASTVKANMDFYANFEKSIGTPEEGAVSGKAHGLADKLFWDSRGLAPKAGVIISWETTDNHSKYSTVAAFINAYHSAIGRPVGMYGPLNALKVLRDDGTIEFTWLPMSSALSGINTSGLNQEKYAAKMEQVAKDNGINLVQNRNRLYNNGADEDYYVTASKIPFSHLQALSGVLQEDDMYDAKAEQRLYDHIDGRLRTYVPRAVLMVLTGQPNALYPQALMDGKGPEKGTLNDFSGFKAQPVAAVLAAQAAALDALATKTGMTPGEIETIIQDSIAKSVINVDINVAGQIQADPTVPTDPTGVTP